MLESIQAEPEKTHKSHSTYHGQRPSVIPDMEVSMLRNLQIVIYARFLFVYVLFIPFECKARAMVRPLLKVGHAGVQAASRLGGCRACGWGGWFPFLPEETLSGVVGWVDGPGHTGPKTDVPVVWSGQMIGC